MVLRLLGYNESDFSGSYPHAQLSKYEQLELNTNINAKQAQNLTRRECMQLIYNTLCSSTKDGKSYCQSIGYSCDEQGNIDLSALLAQNTKGPYVLMNDDFQGYFPFELEKATIYKNGKRVSADNLSKYDAVYYSKELCAVWSYDEKVFGTLEKVSPASDSPTSVTLSSVQYNLTSWEVKNKFSTFGIFSQGNNIMAILDRNGNICEAVFNNEELYLLYKENDDDYLNSLNASLEGPFLVDEQGKWKENITLPVSSITLYYQNSKTDIESIKTNDVIYYSEAYKAAWIYRDRATGILEKVSPDTLSPASITVSGKTYTLSSAAAKYKVSSFGNYGKDDFVTLLIGRNGEVADITDGTISGANFDDDDKISYSELVQSTLKGPYTVLSSDYESDIYTIDFATAQIFKNQVRINAQNIAVNDILYYSSALNTVWVYSDKVSGIIDDITPDTVAPAAVVISGKSYNLETNNIKLKLSSIGTFSIGDRVTILKGKDGMAADIISDYSEPEPIIGVVTGFEKNKSFKDKNDVEYLSNVAHVASVDGNAYSLKTSSYDVRPGSVVRCTLNADKYTVGQIYNSYTDSAIQKLKEAIQTQKFAYDCKIMDVYNENCYKTVTQKELYSMDIDKADVIYFDLDSDGNIKSLVLSDYTGDLHSYGYIHKGSFVGGNYTYKYILDGKYNQYTTSGYIEYGGACFKFKGGKIDTVKSMIKLDNASISANNLVVSDSRVIYPIASDVEVYVVKDGQMTLSSLSQIQNGNYSLDGYINDQPSRCGKVRVIVAKELQQQ